MGVGGGGGMVRGQKVSLCLVCSSSESHSLPQYLEVVLTPFYRGGKRGSEKSCKGLRPILSDFRG